jgi:hypothetical protein
MRKAIRSFIGDRICHCSPEPPRGSRPAPAPSSSTAIPATVTSSFHATSHPAHHHDTHPCRRPTSALPSGPYRSLPPSPPCRSSTSNPAARSPLPRSAPGPTKTSVMWWVEEGGPRVGAKRRGGDPLPQCQAQSQISPRAGSRLSVWGVRLIDVHPNEHPDGRPRTPNGGKDKTVVVGVKQRGDCQRVPLRRGRTSPSRPSARRSGIPGQQAGEGPLAWGSHRRSTSPIRSHAARASMACGRRPAWSSRSLSPVMIASAPDALASAKR